MTSAPRPIREHGQRSEHEERADLRPPVLPPSNAPADSPTDDEIFGAEGSVEFDAAFAAARRARQQKAPVDEAHEAAPEQLEHEKDEPFSGAEKTRLSSVDDELLRQARPDPRHHR